MKSRILISALLVTSCRSLDMYRHDTAQEPFELVLGRGAEWSQEHRGYDPKLPGYHIVGDIASIALRPRTDQIPDKLVLAIRTTPTMPPMLENLTISTANMTISCAPFSPTRLIEVALPQDDIVGSPTSRPKKESYFKCEVAGDEVRVTFLPEAMKLLRNECKISWIDWYR